MVGDLAYMQTLNSCLLRDILFVLKFCDIFEMFREYISGPSGFLNQSATFGLPILYFFNNIPLEMKPHLAR